MIEFGVRLLTPQELVVLRPGLWQPDDRLGWKHVPNADIEINSGHGSARVLTDTEGYRVATNPPSEAAVNILLLGDSFMEAIQVDHEASVAGRLDALLSSQLGQSVRVWNAAVGGWGPSHYLIQARRSFGRHAFDLVLVALYVGNDAEPGRRDPIPPRKETVVHSPRWPKDWTRDEVVDALLYPANDFLERRSHAFQLFKKTHGVLLARLGLSAHSLPSELIAGGGHQGEFERRWRIVASIVDDLRTLASEHGAETLVFLVPSDYQVDPSLLEDYLDVLDVDEQYIDRELPNTLATRALKRQAIEPLDLMPEFARAAAEGARPYGSVDAHWNAEGHAIAARVLADATAARLQSVTSSAREEIE